MSDFYEYKLQDVCLGITDGKHGDCQNEENSGYYFVSCKDIFAGRINLQNARQITEEDYIETHKRTKLDNCDIVITNSGSIGRMAIIDHLYHRITFQKSVAIIKPDRNKIVPRYLYYYLLSNVANLVDISGGTAQKNLLLSDMRNFHIIVSNKVTQDKVACILTSYDDLIENNNRRIAILEEMAQKLYREWFVHFRFPGYENVKMVESEMGMIPEGWEVRPAAKMGKIVGGGTPSTKNEAYFTRQGIPWLCPRDFSKEEVKYIARGQTDISEEGYKASGTKMMPAGAVVFSSRAPIGYTAIALNPLCTNQGFKSIVPNTGISSEYIYYYLKNNLALIDGYASGATFKEISSAQMKLIPFLTPDLKTMSEFDRVAATLGRQTHNLQQKNTNLRKTRDLLLPRLISGDIDVSELDIPTKEA